MMTLRAKYNLHPYLAFNIQETKKVLGVKEKVSCCGRRVSFYCDKREEKRMCAEVVSRES